MTFGDSTPVKRRGEIFLDTKVPRNPTIGKIVLMLENMEDEDIKNIERMLEKENKMKELEKEIYELKKVIGA